MKNLEYKVQRSYTFRVLLRSDNLRLWRLDVRVSYMCRSTVLRYSDLSTPPGAYIYIYIYCVVKLGKEKQERDHIS